MMPLSFRGTSLSPGEPACGIERVSVMLIHPVRHEPHSPRFRRGSVPAPGLQPARVWRLWFHVVTPICETLELESPDADAELRCEGYGTGTLAHTVPPID